MTPAGFLVDLHRCIGCGACVLACRLENGWAAESPWRRVIALNLRRHPGGPTYFLSVSCHHCDKPACVRSCPSGAYRKRPDGVVVHDEQRCLGCRYCEMACPFGAPRFDPARRVVTKCHLCQPRVDAGGRPACVVACPTEALLLRTDTTPDSGRPFLPGFGDPGGCGPATRFQPPRGERRTALLRALEAALARAPRRKLHGEG